MDARTGVERRRAMLVVIFGVTLLGLTAALWWWWGIRMNIQGRRMLLTLTIAAVICTALLAALVGSWWLRAFEEADTTADESLAVVRSSRATFVAAIREARIATRAAPADAPPADVVKEVLDEFDLLEKEIREGTDLSSETLDAIADHARELRRTRANFILPRAAILHVGKAAVDDMREWGVPQGSLQRVTTEIVPLLASPQPADARAALRALLDLHDQWDPYATWYNGFMGRTAAALLVILLFAVAAAGAAFREGHLLTSFALAGIGGATLSVLSRLPPLAAYGEATQYLFRIVSRVGTGFAASLIGAGLLATGVISINLPEVGSFGEMVAECSVYPPRKPRPAVEPSAKGTGAAANAETGPDRATTPPQPCGTPQVLILLAIAMILGFSERALATFEDRVFPAGTLVPVPVARNEGGDGQGGRGPSPVEIETAQTAARQAKEAAARAAEATGASADAADAALAEAQSQDSAAQRPSAVAAAEQAVVAAAVAESATADVVETTETAVDAAEKLGTGATGGGTEHNVAGSSPKRDQETSSPGAGSNEPPALTSDAQVKDGKAQ